MTGSHSLLSVVLVGLVAGGLATGPIPSASAQPRGAPDQVDTLTVDAAVQRALDQNPTIQAARQQRKAAAASIREARSDWFPVIQGEAQYRRLSDNVDYTVDLPSIPGTGNQSVTFAPAILNRYSARATIEQPVFTGLRLPNQLDAAQAQTKAARAQVEATRQDIVFRTRSAYWTLYESRARRAAAEKGLRELDRRLADVRNQHEAGMATESDVLRVRAQRDRVRVQKIQAKNDVESARRTLNDRMGRPLDAPIVLVDTVRVDTTARPPSALVARAREQRPDLAALRQTVQAREAEVDVAQSAWFPQVSLTGSYLYARPNEQLFPPEDRFQGTWDVGVSLSWRLSTGGGTAATVDRRQAQRLQARYELQDRRRAVTVEVRKQVENVEQARRAVAAAETSLESARASYRSVQSRYEEGMVVVSDLLDAEQALRSARADLASAQADYALAQAALDRALGRGNLKNGVTDRKGP